MNYHFTVKSCGLCPFFKIEKIPNQLVCWLNDDQIVIDFNLEKVPSNCPLLTYKSVTISAEEE